jgi:hypothetical protein
VMPSKYDRSTLPVPKDSQLEIKEVPKHKVAVHTSFGTPPSYDWHAWHRPQRQSCGAQSS